MANYVGSARTNCVKYKDVAGLRAALKPFDLEIVEDAEPGKIALLADGESGWPTDGYGDDDQDIIFDFATHVCPFMEDDQILVMTEVGQERLRYLGGFAEAYNARGEKISINLDEIYLRAAVHFNVPLTAIDVF